MVCRAFTAIKEGYTNTWISNNAQFINHYSPDGSSSLTEQEAKAVPSSYVWLVALYWAMTTVPPSPSLLAGSGLAQTSAGFDSPSDTPGAELSAPASQRTAGCSPLLS